MGEIGALGGDDNGGDKTLTVGFQCADGQVLIGVGVVIGDASVGERGGVGDFPVVPGAPELQIPVLAHIVYVLNKLRRGDIAPVRRDDDLVFGEQLHRS